MPSLVHRCRHLYTARNRFQALRLGKNSPLTHCPQPLPFSPSLLPAAQASLKSDQAKLADLQKQEAQMDTSAEQVTQQVEQLAAKMDELKKQVSRGAHPRQAHQAWPVAACPESGPRLRAWPMGLGASAKSC